MVLKKEKSDELESDNELVKAKIQKKKKKY